MCVTSTVIDGWSGPGWPTWPHPHTVPLIPTAPLPEPTPGPNYIPWPTVQADPALAVQMLELLKKLEAIDRRLGMLEQCKVTRREKKILKDRLRRIAKRTAQGKEEKP